MGLFNLVITICVGAVLAFGAALTYKHRMAEAEAQGLPGVAMVSPGQFIKNVASNHAALPKWDDTKWKGLAHHEPGYYKKKADEAAKKAASKQTTK